MPTSTPGQLFNRFTRAVTDIEAGTLNVIGGRIEAQLVDRQLNNDTLVFVDRTTNKVVYACRSSLNVNQAARMSNHNIIETTHDVFSVYVRKFCKHVDIYIVKDKRFDHLTTKSSNKKRQLNAAINGTEGADSMRRELAEADAEIVSLLKRIAEVNATRVALVNRLLTIR